MLQGKISRAKQLSDEPLVTFGLAEIDFELGNFNQAIKEYASLDNRLIYSRRVFLLISGLAFPMQV